MREIAETTIGQHLVKEVYSIQEDGNGDLYLHSQIDGSGCGECFQIPAALRSWLATHVGTEVTPIIADGQNVIQFRRMG